MMESKMCRKWLFTILALALCSSLMLGCRSAKAYLEIEDTDRGNLRKQKVSLITKSTNSAFWGLVHSGASAAATEYNMELSFEGPASEEDFETQNLMIQKAVEDGVNAIVFSAVDYEANAEAIDRAAKAGVTIVVIDSDVNSKKVSCRIGTNNYEAGCRAGEAVLNSDEEVLNIGIVNFDKTTENGQTRERGFRETVEKDRRTVILESVNVLSSIESAKKETMRMLIENPQMNAIVTFNEWTSIGVAEAVKELNAAERTKVIAFDSNVVCVDMMETGEVDGLVVQNPYAMGYLGVENAYKLLSNHPLEGKEINTAVKLVTKETMYSEESQRMLFAIDQKY